MKTPTQTEPIPLVSGYAQADGRMAVSPEKPGWIGTIDPNLTYPRDFEIDYVRVYARDAE